MGKYVGGAITSAINTTKRKEKKKHNHLPPHAESLCFCSTWLYQSELLAAATMERLLFDLGESGGRHGWDETIGTGAFEFCFVVREGAE